MKDPDLRRCSAAARGIWIDMICLMFECQDRGVLATSGVPWTNQEIAASISGNPADNLRHLEELLSKGVARRNEHGAVCCKRMVLDQKARTANTGRQKESRRRRARDELPARNGAVTRLSQRSSSSGDLEVTNTSEVVDDDGGYPFDHFAVIEYLETLKPEPGLSIFQAEAIACAIEDSAASRAVWSNVLQIFKGNGYQRRHAGNAVDRYRSEMLKVAEGERVPPVLLAVPTEAEKQRKQEELERKWQGATA